MKIVSNTKDYYDHVANILGVDETLRYERLPFVTERMPDGSAFYPDDHDLPITQSVADEYRADAANSRFGRRVLGDVWYDRRTVWYLFVGGNAYTVWKDEIGMENNTPIYGPALVREQIECPGWLHGVSMVIGKPVFLLKAVHTKYMHRGANIATVANIPPVLADMGLPRLLDAFSAYSSIQTWMENMRSVSDALNGIPEADNKIKIQAAGFDLKTSFRNR